MNKKLSLLLSLLLIVSFYSFSEDFADKLRIGIVLIENPQSDAGLESLSEAATATIELTLRLVNKYTVERLDFLLPETNLDRSKLYFNNNSFDNAVFGQIERSDEGVYSFLIKGWERKSDSIVVQIEESADSVFDMFDIVDNLTIKFIEELSGEHIGFGKVVFLNEGEEANYNIIYSTEHDDILFMPINKRSRSKKSTIINR